MSKYESLKLRTMKEHCMLQKQSVYFLLQSGNSKIVQDTALAVLDYRDKKDSLFPSTRNIALREFKGLITKIEDAELKEVVEDNISYLEEKGTPLRKTAEVLSAAILYPFCLVGIVSIRGRPVSDF